MIDWTSSMHQTFEYYVVDPGTWKDIKRLDNVISSTINRDSAAETLGSAAINISEAVGECYIRIYMNVSQNGRNEKIPLGTYLIQTPSYTFDGKTKNVTMDGYTPLIELKENYPPLGYAILEQERIMERAYQIVSTQTRAPVVRAADNTQLVYDFIANSEDTWIAFVYDLIANAKYTLGLDEMGRIIFEPDQSITSLQPVWTYDDSNSSILYPSLEMKRDLYGIPNVVEVIYSNGKKYFYAVAENNNVDSPTSIQSRGRRITTRISKPDLVGTPTQEMVQEYANRMLRELSSLEYTITYTHGYCPVRLGDCVRLNYEKAGLKDVKAKVISQSIKCEPGCPVTEKAVFTTNLWGDFR